MNKDDKIKYPYKATSTEQLEERRGQILSDLPPLEGVIRSALITRFIKCGKPNCHCANGDGHKSFYLSSYYHGYTYLDYVPKSYVEAVAERTNNYEKANALLVELSEINLELFRRRELKA